MSESNKQRARRRRRRRALVGPPLKTILSTRVVEHQHGGIARSGRQIAKLLCAAGNSCHRHDVNVPLPALNAGIDVVWHYGDDTYLDQHVEQVRAASARRAENPALGSSRRVLMLINSVFDNTQRRAEAMTQYLRKWCPNGERDIMFVVFTRAAENLPGLHPIRDNLLAVPKTIMAPASKPVGPPFEDRKGILLGEIEKLRRGRLTRGMDVGAAINALRPLGPLYAYAQYRQADTPIPEGVELIPRLEQGAFFSRLSRLRLCVSLVAHETFAMVPAEAQALGVPVLFRSMPQSLDEHFGFSATSFRSVDELAALARRLYHHEPAWAALQAAGITNAAARGAALQAHPLDLCLRTALLRAREWNLASSSIREREPARAWRPPEGAEES